MWEHMVIFVFVRGGKKIEEIKKELDKASLDGWELVAVVGHITEGSYASHTDAFYLFFKRPKQQ